MARAALGDAAWEAAWSEGEALSLDAAVAYARRARGERRRPSSGWASLTPTETDVVRLVTEGLSNPDIAARLFVSRATVKTHLVHVFSKVGVRSRAELAAAAARRGLAPR
jgi:DNA-binding CsgD family transcriptional regulator